MSEHRWSWTSRKKLPSRTGAHMPLMEEILDELERARLGRPRSVSASQMALEESLTNAIRHGNRAGRIEASGCGMQSQPRAILASSDRRRPRLPTAMTCPTARPTKTWNAPAAAAWH